MLVRPELNQKLNLQQTVPDFGHLVGPLVGPFANKYNNISFFIDWKVQMLFHIIYDIVSSGLELERKITLSDSGFATEFGFSELF